MKSTILSFVVFFLAFITFSATAQVTLTEVKVKKPVPGQTVGAGYFSITNLGESSRVLVSVSTEGADRVEMHTHVHHEGVMSMQKMESFEIPANTVMKFEPGKNHLMLFTPNDEALESGEISLEFQFQDGETITTIAEVEGW